MEAFDDASPLVLTVKLVADLVETLGDDEVRRRLLLVLPTSGA